MRTRSQNLGNKNLIGARVKKIRRKKGIKQKDLLAQLQVNGIDMNASSLSKLEGQLRYVSDKELLAISKTLNVSINYILGESEN